MCESFVTKLLIFVNEGIKNKCIFFLVFFRDSHLSEDVVQSFIA